MKWWYILLWFAGACITGYLWGMWTTLARNDRKKRPIGWGKPLLEHHYRGELETGAKFVYCPVGNIVSWNDGDHDNKWCHWCKKFYEDPLR